MFNLYQPTIWQDYITPVNAKNLNRAEQATSQQSKDISILSQTLSEVTVAISNDLFTIQESIVRIENISNSNSNDIKILGETVLKISEALENKVDKNDVPQGSTIDSYFLYKEVYRFIKMI